MSIFGSIMSKIFGSSEAAAASPAAQSASSTAPLRLVPRPPNSRSMLRRYLPISKRRVPSS